AVAALVLFGPGRALERLGQRLVLALLRVELSPQIAELGLERVSVGGRGRGDRRGLALGGFALGAGGRRLGRRSGSGLGSRSGLLFFHAHHGAERAAVVFEVVLDDRDDARGRLARHGLGLGRL